LGEVLFVGVRDLPSLRALRVPMSDSQKTYDRIIRPIENRMMRSIWRVVQDRQDAEDAMQNALLEISNRWDRVCSHPNPQALALKISIDAAYAVTRRRNRGRRVIKLSKVGSEPRDASRSPSDEIIAAEQYFEIMAAIHRLPSQQAIATLLRIVDGQPYEQIAAALECTEATARKHVARGRTRLRSWLAHLDPIPGARNVS
jgi:RNA polymerase sigma-70 factor (ECF subfamily)